MNKRNPVVAGIDTGSTAVKVTLYDGDTMQSWLGPTGWNPGEVSAALLGQACQSWGLDKQNLAGVVGTGYGRMMLTFLTKALTEISCHAKGAAYLWPGVCTVIDIGGQDAKAIQVDANGKVLNFVMNDKCAAGTGRFLQVTANALGLDVAQLGAIECPPGQPICNVNSMCTVFAESEVIGLLHQGFSREAIVSALYRSIARRIATMVSDVGPQPPMLFTGGVAQNRGLCNALEEKFQMPVYVPDQAVFAGAIGAALYAWENINHKHEPLKKCAF